MNLDFDYEEEAILDLVSAQELGDPRLVAARQKALDAVQLAMKTPTTANVTAAQAAKDAADRLDDALEDLGKAQRLHPVGSIHIRHAQAQVNALTASAPKPRSKKRSTKQP